VHSRDVQTRLRLTAVRIGNSEFLLTVTAGGAVRLTRGTGTGQTAQSAATG